MNIVIKSKDSHEMGYIFYMSNEQIVQRTIANIRTVQFQQHSPTHKVGLVLEPGNWEEYDPFLLMAEDTFEKGAFGKHPHRGMETMTYVIEGKLEHFDNKAGSGELNAGDVQWMTAGRGVIHLEDPAEGVQVHSLQLWVNLPKDKKMTEPRYQNLRGQDMSYRQEEGALVRVFSGSSQGVTADTLNHVPVTMVEMTIEQGAMVTQDLPADYRGFLYILEGSGTFGRDQQQAQAGQVLWMADVEDDSLSEIDVKAIEPMKVLLIAGQPLGEPVVARGPFVMNTEGEIKQAYLDYQEGRFEEG